MDETKVVPEETVVEDQMKCPHCGYEWEPRVKKPKRCPKCQKWLQVGVVKRFDQETPRYMMRFIPYDDEGNLKRTAPAIGGKKGLDEGDIVLLPLENRWESWLELVDEDSVPEDELARDQTERDAFMVQAKADEAERARHLRSTRVPPLS